MYELKEYLKSINTTKQNLMDSDDKAWERKYPSFIINKCLAPFNDTIMLINEMNKHCHLDNKLQYDFLFYITSFNLMYSLNNSVSHAVGRSSL